MALAAHLSCISASRPFLRSRGGCKHTILPRRHTPLPLRSGAGLGSTSDELDLGALAKYGGAAVSQVALMSGALWGIQQVLSGPLAEQETASTALVAAFFFAMSLKSRVFSFLDASRPGRDAEAAAKDQKKRPSWTPPPVTFPIVWTTMAFLRTASAVVVWETLGRDLVQLPIILFMVHLTIGDVWNHINNVEKRLGVAIPGCLCVLASAIVLDAAYFNVNPTAGYLLLPLPIWLVVANALVYSIWDLNGRPPLYPTKA